jgi:AmmeMemoRadiSam system protein B
MLRAPGSRGSSGTIRPPSVAGSFYPAEREVLATLVDGILAEADRLAPANEPSAGTIVGLLVPHAGLAYSGVVAAAGWRTLRPRPPARSTTVVLLGTNHGAGWLDGVAVWETGAWRTPLGDVVVDDDLAGAIVDLGPPFLVDRAAHLGEHSIEVQLPLLATVDPGARIVALSVADGTGPEAVEAGRRLGDLLARRREMGTRVVVAISSDMAHYPSAGASERVTAGLLRPIVDLDPVALARDERAVVESGTPGLVCGMCGIQPTVLGLSALRAFGANHGSLRADATSADAGGPTSRTVGYLAVAFTT